MVKYGDCAIEAVRLITNKGYSPADAWRKTTTDEFGRGSESQKKGCPRGAFLGLCENGDVKGVPGGNYTRSKLNKRYAVRAVQILRSNSRLASNKNMLWQRVVSGNRKQHNNQLDVVLALWNNNLII